MSDTILTCSDCMGRYNGRNITHTHTGGETVDDRFLTCACRGKGAITCETCEGAGRIVIRDGVRIGTHAKPATMNALGPNPKKALGGHR